MSFQILLNQFKSLNLLRTSQLTKICSYSSQSKNVNNDLLSKPALLNYNQVANFRKFAYNNKRYWVKRRGGGYDEGLTQENKQFLNEVVVDQYSSSSPLAQAPWPRGKYNPETPNKRLGVLAVKLGSQPQWTASGKKFHVTLLQVLDNHVIDYVPPEILVSKNLEMRKRTKDGRLGMAIVGALSSDPRLYTEQYIKLFDNSGVPPKRKLTKFMITPNAAVQPGTPLYANHYRVGDYVDVGARTIGFGFQGVMKKWGMKGGPRSHGATKFHRKRGTIASGRKRKPIKGIKMAGRMGSRWRQLKGLKIWRVNSKYNILYVQGPVMPGPSHCYVRITDSCLPKMRHNLSAESHPPFPTYFADDDHEATAEEHIDKDLHNFSGETITFDHLDIKQLKKRDGAKIAKLKN